MWAHTAATVIHAVGHLATDDPTPTTTPTSTGGGGDSNTVIVAAMSLAGGIVIAVLGYLGNRNRNRDDRRNELDNAENMGGLKQRVTELEDDREDEKEARRVIDAKVAENTHRIEQLEEVNRVVSIPPTHPSRHRKPPKT